MNAEQIREVVKITIDELMSRNLLNSTDYQYVLSVVDKKLYNYFDNKTGCKGVAGALRSLSDDSYIDVIYLQYRDRKTMEWIAEAMEKDVSTIKRNKKRLIMAIYRKLEG